MTRSNNPASPSFKLNDRRLNQQQQTSLKTGKSFFTSDLSANEYLLAREAGCEPIGLVVGSCFYQAGFYRNLWGYRGKTGEVEALTQAQLAARELAVSRLQQEAALLGAHGVIGVRIHRQDKYWGVGGMAEFTAIGTAIRIPGQPPTQQPFTSDLSGQEFWQLRQAGYQPKGLVFGTCSYYVHSDRTTRSLMNRSAVWDWLFGISIPNQEIVQFTQGFHDARELAISRLSNEIQQLGAAGAVGMEMDISEEVIVYQPNSLASWLYWILFIFGFVIAISIAVSMQMVSGMVWLPAVNAAIVIVVVSRSIWNSFTSPGPTRDLLTHFVATGTAISPSDLPAANPISKTLIFYPLTKA